MTRPVYVLQVRAEPGVDATRALRAWLKTGLQMYGLRCVEVREEPQTQEAIMPIDLTDTESQSDPIPAGVYRLRAKLMAGTAGTDHVLKVARNGVDLMLVLECTVIEGKHRGRKLWDYTTCELDEQGVITPLSQDELEEHQAFVHRGRSKLRAIIDSAHGLNPKDKSEAAQARNHASLRLLRCLRWHRVLGASQRTPRQQRLCRRQQHQFHHHAGPAELSAENERTTGCGAKQAIVAA